MDLKYSWVRQIQANSAAEDTAQPILQAFHCLHTLFIGIAQISLLKELAHLFGWCLVKLVTAWSCVNGDHGTLMTTRKVHVGHVDESWFVCSRSFSSSWIWGRTAPKKSPEVWNQTRACTDSKKYIRHRIFVDYIGGWKHSSKVYPLRSEGLVFVCVFQCALGSPARKHPIGPFIFYQRYRHLSPKIRILQKNKTKSVWNAPSDNDFWSVLLSFDSSESIRANSISQSSLHRLTKWDDQRPDPMHLKKMFYAHKGR